MNPKRPYEVTVAGMIILGMGLFLSLYFLTTYFFLKHIFSLQSHPAPFPYARLVISLIMTAGFAVLGFFILRLRNWARIFSLVQMLCWMIMGLTQVRESYAAGFASPAWHSCLIFFLMPASVCIYLLTLPKVVKQFEADRGRSGDRRTKVFAYGTGSLLIILYLSAPYGVWDGNSKAGRMASQLRTFFVPAKHAAPEKPGTFPSFRVSEPSGVVALPVQQDTPAAKAELSRELPAGTSKLAAKASKSSLEEKPLPGSPLFQDTKGG